MKYPSKQECGFESRIDQTLTMVFIVDYENPELKTSFYRRSQYYTSTLLHEYVVKLFSPPFSAGNSYTGLIFKLFRDFQGLSNAPRRPIFDVS